MFLSSRCFVVVGNEALCPSFGLEFPEVLIIRTILNLDCNHSLIVKRSFSPK